MRYKTDRQSLEREVRVETFRGSGPGGQHRNVTESAVRLTHQPSGVVVTASENRSQHRNKETAFERLKQRLQVLNRVRTRRIPTKPTPGARRKTLAKKKLHQKVKEMRSRVHPEQ
jgi:protein subunit release factor A